MNRKTQTALRMENYADKAARLFSLALLFTGLISILQLLTVIAGGRPAAEILAHGIMTRSGLLNWASTVLLAFGAFISVRLSASAARAAHANCWNACAVFLLMLSASEAGGSQEAFFWSYLINSPPSAYLYVLYGLMIVVFAAAGVLMKSALEGSIEAAQYAAAGSLLFAAGQIGTACIIAFSSEPLEMGYLLFLCAVAKSLGSAGIMGGLMFHEFYLNRQMERLEAGRHFEGIPSVKSETAAWTMRMIGTPTAGEEKERVHEEDRSDALAPEKKEEV